MEKGNNMDNFQTNYLTEVSLRIQHEGFTVYEGKDELLGWQSSM